MFLWNLSHHKLKPLKQTQNVTGFRLGSKLETWDCLGQTNVGSATGRHVGLDPLLLKIFQKILPAINSTHEWNAWQKWNKYYSLAVFWGCSRVEKLSGLDQLNGTCWENSLFVVRYQKRSVWCLMAHKEHHQSAIKPKNIGLQLLYLLLVHYLWSLLSLCHDCMSCIVQIIVTWNAKIHPRGM